MTDGRTGTSYGLGSRALECYRVGCHYCHCCYPSFSSPGSAPCPGLRSKGSDSQNFRPGQLGFQPVLGTGTESPGWRLRPHRLLPLARSTHPSAQSKVKMQLRDTETNAVVTSANADGRSSWLSRDRAGPAPGAGRVNPPRFPGCRPISDR